MKNIILNHISLIGSLHHTVIRFETLGCLIVGVSLAQRDYDLYQQELRFGLENCFSFDLKRAEASVSVIDTILPNGEAHSFQLTFNHEMNFCNNIAVLELLRKATGNRCVVPDSGDTFCRQRVEKSSRQALGNKERNSRRAYIKSMSSCA